MSKTKATVLLGLVLLAIMFGFASGIYSVVTGDQLASNVHYNTFGRVSIALSMMIVLAVFWGKLIPAWRRGE